MAGVGFAATVQHVLSEIDLILTNWDMEVDGELQAVGLEAVDIHMNGMIEMETGPVGVAGSEAGSVDTFDLLLQALAQVVVAVLADEVVRTSAEVAAGELAAAVDKIRTSAVAAAVGAAAGAAAAATEAVAAAVVVAASVLSAAVAEAAVAAAAARASVAAAAAVLAIRAAAEKAVPESVVVFVPEAELQIVAWWLQRL